MQKIMPVIPNKPHIQDTVIYFTSSAAQQQSKKPQSDKKLADLPLLELNMAREEGEGMETTETESVSTAGTPPPSLEQLLTSPDPKHGNVYSTVIPCFFPQYHFILSTIYVFTMQV